MPRPSNPPRAGSGTLAWGRETHQVEFSITFWSSEGRRIGRGAVTGDPDAMRRAFKSGRAQLAFNDGVLLAVSVLAHSEGSPTAYFELE